MLKEANPDNAVLQIKSLEAFAKAADGKVIKDNPSHQRFRDCRSYKVNCRNSCDKTEK